MLKSRIVPCLLLNGRNLVKTVRFSKPNYIGNPINTVQIYNEKEVDEIIILDIFASSKNKEIQFDLIAELASECFMPVTYGGGVKSMKQFGMLFKLGVEKVSINSAGVENPQLIAEVAKEFGNQSIVVSMDIKKDFFGRYRQRTNNGNTSYSVDILEQAKKYEELGAGELLITSIDRDGTFKGYDIGLIKAVSSVVSIPVIANGGAASVQDLELAITLGGASAAACGSMVVYQNKNKGVLINFPSKDELRHIP